MSEDKTIKGLLERLSNDNLPLEGRVAILTVLELKTISKQLTSIAESLKKIANPMLGVRDFKWDDDGSPIEKPFYVDTTKGTQPCQNCCKTAGDKIKGIQEVGNG